MDRIKSWCLTGYNCSILAGTLGYFFCMVGDGGDRWREYSFEIAPVFPGAPEILVEIYSGPWSYHVMAPTFDEFEKYSWSDCPSIADGELPFEYIDQTCASVKTAQECMVFATMFFTAAFIINVMLYLNQEVKIPQPKYVLGVLYLLCSLLEWIALGEVSWTWLGPLARPPSSATRAVSTSALTSPPPHPPPEQMGTPHGSTGSWVTFGSLCSLVAGVSLFVSKDAGGAVPLQTLASGTTAYTGI